eukprot:TRINITY_DN3310_c0_g1_i3.p1 TRINITY_DN3310_c0_g1~~TRINITY_DN3310_c0_g1_i3.p1  ORF type:complete len:595 (+),score=118.35 TRINITY_DN3310_c0_g1_i3:95-1879(+)
MASDPGFSICTSASDAPPIHWIAAQLSSWLSTIACPGVIIPVENITTSRPNCLAIGPTPAGLIGFSYPTTNPAHPEAFAAGAVPPSSYALTGDPRQHLSARGTIYAATDFAEVAGIRFLSSDMPAVRAVGASCPFVNSTAPFSAFASQRAFTPPFEYRSIAAYDLLQHTDLQVLQRNNGLGSLEGGGTVYATPPGFVHTSYNLLENKSALFESHNEWFWPRDNPETYGQLCWSNASLVEYMTGRVKEFLRAQPTATVISVSQNDNYLFCNSTEEREIYAQEGALMGPLLRAVNAIADAVAQEFGDRPVAIDTLAYQWTRQAPTITKPRPNVIIRLCSIECNFGAPLTDASNSKFQTDIRAWGQISNRTWIWNYVTDFAGYVMPWPDYFSLAPNTQFYLNHGVKGIYQEAAYQSYGSDLAELKSYLMSKVMFDPEMADPELLTAEFTALYYSPAASSYISSYVALWAQAVSSTEFYLRENVPVSSSYLTPRLLLQSAALMESAVAAGTENGTVLQVKHCRTATMPTLYVILLRWGEIQSFATSQQIPWPYPAQTTIQAGFDRFSADFKAVRATHLNEGGNDLSWLAKQINVTQLS